MILLMIAGKLHRWHGLRGWISRRRQRQRDGSRIATRCSHAAAVLLLLLTAAGCAPPTNAPDHSQPPPPQFLFNKDFPSDKGNMQVTLDREIYPPHYVGLWHTHPGPGSLCVLQGALTVEVSGQADVPLPAGACWAEPPGVAHRPANLADQQAVALFYLMAPAGQPRIIAAPTPAAR